MFALLIGFAMQQFSHWVDLLMPSLPDWLSFLQYIVWPLFVLLVLVIVFFTFTMVANIISAPFNGFLSERSRWWFAAATTSRHSAGPNCWR